MSTALAPEKVEQPCYEHLIYVIYQPKTGRYICNIYGPAHGLAAFLTEIAAQRYVDFQPQINGVEFKAVTFEEAIEIARNRPIEVKSVMFLDDIDRPRLFWFR